MKAPWNAAIGWVVLVALTIAPLHARDATAAPQQTSSKDGDRPATDAVVERDGNSEIERLEAEIANLKARMDASEEAAIAQAGGSHFEPTFDVYGYLAVDVWRWFLDDDNALGGIVSKNLSFSVQNLNVYFSSHMTESLSALAEIRFMALPQGADKSLVPYERYDTTVTDPRTSETLSLGSIDIERAQMVWQPYDAFGITAGRFFTPSGIWNLEHSPVVIVPRVLPYLMIRQTIPLAQTGVAVQGRFFPAKNTYLDYAVTLSNGRGPTEEVYDLDDDKAVGLRLKGMYEKDDFGISLGCYGFYGTMTDSVKQLVADPAFNIEVKTTEKYRELAGAADFRLELFGVMLQAEWAGGYIEYDVRPQKTYPVINADVVGNQYQPDFLRFDVYGLLAWTLPLDKWLEDQPVTIFTMLEYSVMDDTDPNYDTWVARWGLNFKPVSFVVLKIDAEMLWLPNSDIIRGKAYAAGGQAAVAF